MSKMTAVDNKVAPYHRSRHGSVQFGSISLITPKNMNRTSPKIDINDNTNSKFEFHGTTADIDNSHTNRSYNKQNSEVYSNNRRSSKFDISHHTKLDSEPNENSNWKQHFDRRSSLATSDGFLQNRKKSRSLTDGKLVSQLSSNSKDDVFEERKGRSRIKSLRVQDRRRELYKKFQMVAKMTVFCIREAKGHILRTLNFLVNSGIALPISQGINGFDFSSEVNKAYDEIGPYLNSLHFSSDFDAESELLFDPNKFKADKQLRISEETKRILRKPWFERNEKELHYAQVALRNIAAYAEYPVRMQRKIVEVGIYEKYDAKRVVVREGHPASAFYFLLSGSVVVLVYQGDTKVAKPVAYLKKGQTFGELAIIHRTMRQSTIVAKEQIELLSIDIKDFHNIFMAGGVKSITDPDHNTFISNLAVFHGWPIDKMAEDQDQCVFHYFKRGDVLVKDSNFSEWIVIVKSGSLNVLKKLKRVEAYKRITDVVEVKNDKQKKGEIELRKKQRRYVLPDIHIPLRPIEDDKDITISPIVTENKKTKQVTYSNKTIAVVSKTPVLPHLQSGNSTERNINKQVYNTGLVSQSSDSIFTRVQLKGLPPVFGELATSRPKTSFTPWSLKHQHTRKEHHTFVATSRTPEDLFNSDVCDNATTNGASEKDSKSGNINLFKHTDSFNYSTTSETRKFKTQKAEEEEEIIDKLHGKKNAIRTITQDLDAKFNQKDPDDWTVADRDPQFVHIQTLTKGQVFGVSELVLGQQPSFCLVSNGAECIMLNKSFYMQHASEALLRELRQDCSPYPSDEDMQLELQATVDWQAFRSSTFRDTLHSLTKIKIKIS